MYIYNTISVPRESRGPHIDKLALPEKLSVSGSGRNSAARLSLAGPACLHQQRVYGDEEVTSALPRGIGGRGKMMAASRARRFALTTQEPVSRVVNASSSVFDGVRPPMELPGPPTLCARCKEKGNARRSERRCDCECAGGGAPYHIWGAWQRERRQRRTHRWPPGPQSIVAGADAAQRNGLWPCRSLVASSMLLRVRHA